MKKVNAVPLVRNWGEKAVFFYGKYPVNAKTCVKRSFAESLKVKKNRYFQLCFKIKQYLLNKTFFKVFVEFY
jgi:hypothetical protein